MGRIQGRKHAKTKEKLAKILDRLGKISDREAAELSGLSIPTIRKARKELGIQELAPTSKLAAHIDQLGQVPDRELAQLAGCTPQYVQFYRQERGIPAFREQHRNRRRALPSSAPPSRGAIMEREDIEAAITPPADNLGVVLPGFHARVRAISGTTPRTIRNGRVAQPYINRSSTLVPVILLGDPEDPRPGIILIDPEGRPFLARLDVYPVSIGSFYCITSGQDNLAAISMERLLPEDIARMVGVPAVAPRESEAGRIFKMVTDWQDGLSASGIPDSLLGPLWEAQRGQIHPILAGFPSPPSLDAIRSALEPVKNPKTLRKKANAEPGKNKPAKRHKPSKERIEGPVELSINPANPSQWRFRPKKEQ